jgi:hypothetical protein
MFEDAIYEMSESRCYVRTAALFEKIKKILKKYLIF